MKGTFASIVAGAVIAGFMVVPRPAAAQTVELKVSHYLPPNHQMHQNLVEWSKDLDQRSNGRLKLTVFPAGQMGPMPRQFDLARTGVADIAFFLHGALPGRFPLTELSHLPTVFNRGGKGISTSEASGILTELAPDLAAEHGGTKPLYFIATPSLNLYFNKPAVRSPAGMRGYRIRHNGPIAAAMLEAWGAAPAAIPPAELADALSKGTVAGMVFNYEAAKSFQLAQSLTSVTPLNVAAGTFALVMNADKYKALPDDLRKMIDDTTGPAAARRVGAIYDSAEEEGRKYLLDAKVEILELSPAERKAFDDPLKPIVETFVSRAEAKSLPAKAFFEKLRAAVDGKR